MSDIGQIMAECDCQHSACWDRKYCMAAKVDSLTVERDEHWASFVHWRKEADALTEQLEAARADAKEAEAYADELEGDLTELCRQLLAAEDKLAKAVEALKEALYFLNPTESDMEKRAGIYRIVTTLAEIEGEKG